MAINITDSGSSIKIEITTAYQSSGTTYPAQTVFLPKSEVEIKTHVDNILIAADRASFIFLYSDITTPSGGSADAVAALIEAFADTDTSSSESHIGEVGGNLITVSVEKTRPANATPYTALDVVNESASAGTVWTFANLARINQGSGYITKGRLVTDQKANTARFRVHLFHTAPAAVINDNAANAIIYADFTKKIGSFDLPAMTTEDATASTGATAMRDDIRIPFNLDAGTRSVIAVLETLDAFTPASGQKFYLELTADNN